MLVTNKTNSNNWQDKPEVKKGNIGENIVDNHLRERGLVPYYPNSENAHPFDRLCATMDKRKLLIAEVKTKAKRTYYPDTGFDYKHYECYCNVRNKYNLPIFVYFVDENTGDIYGNTLRELEKETEITHNFKILNYPLKQKANTGKMIIYFPIQNMKPVGKLTSKQMIELKNLSRRNYQYEN